MDHSPIRKFEFDELRNELAIYRMNTSITDAEVLRRICEMRGWTLEEFNEALQERYTFLKLQGKI